jgi:DNA-binding NarL/FixJ family response regulator
MRVLIADDHPLFRDGLRSVLESHGFKVVGEAETGLQALELSARLEPDVVLMDLGMPQLGGLAATRLLSVQQPRVKVVVLTASADESDVFEAVKSGAQGYLLKDVSGEDFARALDGLASDEPILSPAIARKVLGEFGSPPARNHPSGPDSLTSREQEVLQLLIQGVTTTQELAARLVVTDNTIKFHLRNILDKLHVHNRAEVVAYASRHGVGATSRDQQR